jgi:hypothetical protein
MEANNWAEATCAIQHQEPEGPRDQGQSMESTRLYQPVLRPGQTPGGELRYLHIKKKGTAPKCGVRFYPGRCCDANLIVS